MMDTTTFLQMHEPQLILSDVPEHLWDSLRQKLNDEIFDAGDCFAMIREESSWEEGDTGPKWLIQATEKISTEDSNSIFIIDHAWTFRYDKAREQLMDNPVLLRRMCELIGMDYSDSTLDTSARKMSVFRIRKSSEPDLSSYQSPMKESGETGEGDRQISVEMEGEDDKETEGKEEEPLMTTKQIDAVLREMWKFAQTYSIRAPGLKTEQQMPVWYIMDEFGSRIQHSEESNVRVVPFYFAGTGMFYSVMFPTKNLLDGDEVTRDYVEISEYRRAEWKEFYLLPWKEVDHSHLPLDNAELTDDFFNMGREAEVMPEGGVSGGVEVEVERGGKLRVYADDDALVKHLEPELFEMVQTEDMADILWLRNHFKNFKDLAENHTRTMINQFPNESILTVKDLLAAAIQNSYRKRGEEEGREGLEERRPHWFPLTYNLRTELPHFVSMFQNRAKKNLNNHWIVKPWNLARGLDTYVTSDLGQIIRLIDSGPKIACKYLEDPVLFYREDIEGWVKFDLRFILLLKSVKPLEVYVYDRFWLRFALKPFSLSECDDYEKHFTVFNYLDEEKILQMKCEDFVKKFEEQNPGLSWKGVEGKVMEVMKEAFDISREDPPPRGIPHNPQSRAIYGLDIMLRWRKTESGEKEVEPVLLEVNFMPDCERACDYYPDFADTVFNTLFRSGDTPKFVTKL